MYALVEILGKQYKAQKGDLLMIDKMEAEANSAVEFDNVLMLGGESVKVGTPYVSGAKVKATVKEFVKGEKTTAFKFKRRKGYQRKIGNRQTFTLVQVDEILA